MAKANISSAPKPFSPVLYNAQMVYGEKKIYCLGKTMRDVDAYLVDQSIMELWEFDTDVYVWKYRKTSNVPTLLNFKLTLHGKVLLFEGHKYVAEFGTCLFLYKCDLSEEDPFFILTEMNGRIPTAIEGRSNFVKDDYYYTFGGELAKGALMDVRKLNLLTNVWEKVKPCRNLITRHYHQATLVGNQVYILGGRDTNDFCDFERLAMYDLDREVCIHLKTFPEDVDIGYPTSRINHSACYVPGTRSIIMTGGMTQELLVLECTWRLELKNLRWRKLNRPRKKVFLHKTIVNSEFEIFTFGGLSDYINEVQQHDLFATILDKNDLVI